MSIFTVFRYPVKNFITTPGFGQYPWSGKSGIRNQRLVEINVRKHLAKIVIGASLRGGINYFLQKRMWPMILVNAWAVTFNMKKCKKMVFLWTHTHTHNTKHEGLFDECFQSRPGSPTMRGSPGVNKEKCQWRSLLINTSSPEVQRV